MRFLHALCFPLDGGVPGPACAQVVHSSCQSVCVATPQMFRFVWDEANADVKRSLVKLAGTWEPLLPTATSTAVGRIIRPPTRPAAPVPPAAAPVPPVAAPTGPRMGVPGHAPPPPQHASPPHASYGHSAAPPPPLRRDPRMPPSTVPLPVPRPPPQPVYGTVPAPQQQSLLAVAPPPTCLQQPVGTSYGMAAHAAPSTIAAAVAPPVAPPSAPFASGKDLMAALVSLGTKLAGNAAGGGAAGGSNGNAGHSAETGLSSSKQQRAPGAGKVIGALDFHASILKVRRCEEAAPRAVARQVSCTWRNVEFWRHDGGTHGARCARDCSVAVPLCVVLLHARLLIPERLSIAGCERRSVRSLCW